MHYFPICLNIKNRPCVVIGGGRVAERKVRGLLASGGRVRIVSPELTAGLAALVEAGKVSWSRRGYQEGDLAGAFLTISATDDQQVQTRVFAEAEAANQLINVADVPEKCNFILPASMSRGDLTVSVSTAGRSPAMASRVRKELEERIGEEYGVAVELLGRLRPLVLGLGKSHRENKVLFNSIVESGLLEWIRTGDWNAVQSHLREILGEEADLAPLADLFDQNINRAAAGSCQR